MLRSRATSHAASGQIRTLWLGQRQWLQWLRWLRRLARDVTRVIWRGAIVDAYLFWAVPDGKRKPQAPR